MWPNMQETFDLVTFTEEILNEKLHFLCSVMEAKHCRGRKINMMYVLWKYATFYHEYRFSFVLPFKKAVKIRI